MAPGTLGGRPWGRPPGGCRQRAPTTLKNRYRSVGIAPVAQPICWAAVIAATSLPAARVDQHAWLVTPTTGTSHHPPAGPARMWLWAGKGTSATAVGVTPRAPAIR